MKLRSDQFQAVVRREIGFFDMKENAVGELTTRLSDDARVVTKATGQATAQQIQVGSGVGVRECFCGFLFALVGTSVLFQYFVEFCVCVCACVYINSITFSSSPPP